MATWQLCIIDIDSRFLNISRWQLGVIDYHNNASYRIWIKTKLSAKSIILGVILHQKFKNMKFRGKILICDFLLNFVNVKIIYFVLYCCKTQNFSFSALGKKFVQKRIHEISGSLIISKQRWRGRQSSTYQRLTIGIAGSAGERRKHIEMKRKSEKIYNNWSFWTKTLCSSSAVEKLKLTRNCKCR